MTKTKILDKIQNERQALENLLDQLDQNQMLAPGVENDWNVKDILAHITAWEKMMCRWLQEAVRGEVPERPAPGMTWDDLDQLNAQIYRQNQDKPLAEVLTEFQRSYDVALEIVKSIAEKDLIDPDRFAWREGDPLWHMVGGNTFWHYQEHAETIRGWMEQ